LPRRPRERLSLDQRVPRRWLLAEARGCVALRIEVNHERPLAGRGQARRQIDRRRRFADAALLVGHAQHSDQGTPSVIPNRRDDSRGRRNPKPEFAPSPHIGLALHSRTFHVERKSGIACAFHVKRASCPGISTRATPRQNATPIFLARPGD